MGALVCLLLASCAPAVLYGNQPGHPCSALVRCEVPVPAPGTLPAAYCGEGLRCCATVLSRTGQHCTDCGNGWVCR